MIFDKLFKSLNQEADNPEADQDKKCLDLITKYQNIIDMLHKPLAQQRIFDPMEYKPIEEQVGKLLADYNRREVSSLRDSKHYQHLLDTRDVANFKYSNFSIDMRKHNDTLWSSHIPQARELIGGVNGQPLDDQQMLSVVKNAHSHLILVGKGRDKSIPIVGKVKYELTHKKLKPEDILILSFTDDSAAALQKKIENEVKGPIKVSTFKKLGLDILSDSQSASPSITSLKMNDFLKKQILDLMQTDSTYRAKVWCYMLNCGVTPESEFDFSDREDHDEYLRLNQPKTFNGENVKSYGEMFIANFLHQNNIRYEYAKKYPFNTANAEFEDYAPSFYLTDYNIWIEYFVVDKEGQVPSYWDCSKEDYQQSIQQKELYHKAHGTTLLPCYAFQHYDDTLLNHLTTHLQSYGIPVPKLPKDVFASDLSDEQTAVFDNLIEMSSTIVNLLKSNRCDINTLRTRNADLGHLQHRNRLIIDIVAPLFEAYQERLQSQGEIDFNDIIYYAINTVKENKHLHDYSLVIVNEYQNISKPEFNLLKAMRDQKDYSLYCVGDDWSSMYCPPRSDFDVILNFDKYWGPTEISKIETTEKFQKSRTEWIGGTRTFNPARINKPSYWLDTYGMSVNIINDYTDRCAIETTASHLDALPQNSSVCFIGRHAFDAKLLQVNNIFQCEYNNATGLVDVCYSKRPDLEIQFVTAHQAKDLQADYVFIIDNKSCNLGFSRHSQDAPIFQLLMDNCDTFPLIEETMLQHAACTCARRKTFIIIVSKQEGSISK